MTEPAKYDVRAALASICLAMIDGEAPDVRAILAEETDIPEDRLDFATEEVTSQLGQLRVLLKVHSIATGGQTPTKDDLVAMFPKALWVDDTKGTASIGVTVHDEDGDEIFRASTEYKMDTAPDEDAEFKRWEREADMY